MKKHFPNFLASWIPCCILVMLNNACMAVRDPSASQPTEELVAPPTNANTSSREEILLREVMEFDTRPINVFFFMDPHPNPTYGILWIDGEIYKLNLDQTSFDKWKDTEQSQDVLHFVTKFVDNSELRLLIDSKTQKIIKPWYGDWQPSEGANEVRIPVAKDESRQDLETFLWLSKAESDFALLERGNDVFLLKCDIEATKQHNETGSDTVLRFESEDTDAADRKIKPLIYAEISGIPQSASISEGLPANQEKLFKATLIDFPSEPFRTSTDKIFSTGPK